MTANFNGTLSGMNQANVLPSLILFQKVNFFLLSCYTTEIQDFYF